MVGDSATTLKVVLPRLCRGMTHWQSMAVHERVSILYKIVLSQSRRQTV